MVRTYMMNVHLYEHEDGLDTYSVLVWQSTAGKDLRKPLFSFTGTMPWRAGEDPRPVLRAILRRLTID